MSEFLAFDRRKVAMHEAGHAVVGLELGSRHAWLSLDRDYSKIGANSVIKGRCGTSRLKGKVRNAALSYAGVVADMLDDDFDTSKDTARENIELKDYLPSLTDMICINALCPMWRDRAIQLSLNILQDNWQAVRGVAFALYESQNDVIFTAVYWKQTKWRGLL